MIPMGKYTMKSLEDHCNRQTAEELIRLEKEKRKVINTIKKHTINLGNEYRDYQQYNDQVGNQNKSFDEFLNDKFNVEITIKKKTYVTDKNTINKLTKIDKTIKKYQKDCEMEL